MSMRALIARAYAACLFGVALIATWGDREHARALVRTARGDR